MLQQLKKFRGGACKFQGAGNLSYPPTSKMFVIQIWTELTHCDDTDNNYNQIWSECVSAPGLVDYPTTLLHLSCSAPNSRQYSLVVAILSHHHRTTLGYFQPEHPVLLKFEDWPMVSCVILYLQQNNAASHKKVNVSITGTISNKSKNRTVCRTD